MKSYDVIVVGAGIVGLATAYKLLEKDPKLKVAVLEKEKEIAKHQTGNNSGVIHSGIYYKPGSLKAINCQTGYRKLLDFCQDEGIDHEICGKIIVATDESELTALNNIHKRGTENGLADLRLVSSEELKEIEPHVSAVKGLVVPQAGIVNYKKVSAKYQEKIEQAGGEVYLGEKIIQMDEKSDGVEIVSDNTTWKAKAVINCAGLYSDKVAGLNIDSLDLKILPFRGEYYELRKESWGLVKNLIYPVPNPEFPFLGVHFTRMIDGGVEAGPNAVLAFRREGYRKRDIHLAELFETLLFPGFHQIALKYWKEGSEEMYRSFSKAAFVRSLQKLVPKIQSEDLVPGGAGVRAQACTREGKLVDDFLIINNKRIINVCNAPSPAATSSLSIGETIAKEIFKSQN